MKSYIDTLLILSIVCIAVVIVALLVFGIIRLIVKIRDCNIERGYEENMVAVSVYRSVCERTDSLLPVDKFEAATQIAFKKNDLSDSSLDKLAEKIAEAATENQFSDMAIETIER